MVQNRDDEISVLTQVSLPPDVAALAAALCGVPETVPETTSFSLPLHLSLSLTHTHTHWCSGAGGRRDDAGQPARGGRLALGPLGAVARCRQDGVEQGHARGTAHIVSAKYYPYPTFCRRKLTEVNRNASVSTFEKSAKPTEA